MIVNSALGLIENTQLIALTNIYDGPGRLYAKAEFIQPGGSVKDPKHNMQGTGYGLVVPHWDEALVDRYIAITSQEAEDYRKLLAVKESLHVGFSAAANVCASIKLMQSGLLGENPVVATTLCDSGMK
jgi:cysteine synthase A